MTGIYFIIAFHLNDWSADPRFWPGTKIVPPIWLLWTHFDRAPVLKSQHGSASKFLCDHTWPPISASSLRPSHRHDLFSC